MKMKKNQMIKIITKLKVPDASGIFATAVAKL